MKRLLLITVIMNGVLMMNGVSQNLKRNPLPPPPSPNEKWLKCVPLNKYSAVQRKQFYPFNQSSLVKIISFKEYINIDTLITGVTESTIFADLQNQPKIFESFTLNQKQLNELTYILYNYGFKTKKYEEESMCYYPRNAIVFYDKKGLPFEWIELCFECNGYKKTSKQVKTGDFCIGKYELLKHFFKKHKIHYGIDS
ncbi:hypothetical protein VB264_23315 [Arcicella aquatica]|uniref:Uncharacterized protein n=1 Tax=Arcicella aquatica TaxID=217141 RepID=A0ABU5QUQ0_9BACT|nr:hypothetical protein [Arcicella aquatica]MEA5260748.1 hypothetical protein [Arcicella aquatica]